MENNTKRCPFCGEEIKATAIKCKFCGEFLNNENSGNTVYKNNRNNRVKNIGIGCVSIIAFFFVLGIISLFLPESSDNLDSSINSDSSYNYSENENSDYNSALEEPQVGYVTGTYSGFGSWNVAFSNLGGQNANCLESGAGKSLVNELEKMINESSPQNNPVLYSISSYNPNLTFEVSNPRWAENVYDMNKCIADITFRNYKPDTIAGYKGYGANAVPYTIDEAQFGVTYYVSNLGTKYKANIRQVGCDPIQGYYE